MDTNRNASTGSASSTDLIGIDDGPFIGRHALEGRRHEPLAPLVVAQLNGPNIVRLKTGQIRVDGMDGTRIALRLLRHFPRRTPVLLSGVTYGGFNLINPHIIQYQQDAPVIVVIGFRPRNRSVKRALVRHFPDWRERWSILRSLGKLHSVRTFRSEPPIFYESFNCSQQEARRILARSALVSRTPEPIRVAAILARGLSA